jgi:hypothetical protein
MGRCCSRHESRTEHPNPGSLLRHRPRLLRGHQTLQAWLDHPWDRHLARQSRHREGESCGFGDYVSQNVEFWEGTAAELDTIPGLLRDGGDGMSGMTSSRAVLRSCSCPATEARCCANGRNICSLAELSSLMSHRRRLRLWFDFSRVVGMYGVPTAERNWVMSNDSMRECH